MKLPGIVGRRMYLAVLSSMLLACGGGGGGAGGSSAPGGGAPEASPGGPVDTVVDAACSNPLENPLELFSGASISRLVEPDTTDVPLSTVPNTSQYAQGRLLVKLKPISATDSVLRAQSASTSKGLSVAGIRLSALGTVPLNGTAQMRALSTAGAPLAKALAESASVYIAEVAGGQAALMEAKNKLRASSQVESVEFDHQLYLSTQSRPASAFVQTSSAPNFESDPTVSGTRAGAQTPLSSGAAYTTSSVGLSDPIVAVIDTGVYAEHPELAAFMWRNPGEIAANGKDDDGDGYIDNLHGADVVAFSGNTSPYSNTSANSHGTQVAGVIRNATRGAESLGSKVKIMALKVQGSNGLIYTSDVIRAQNFILQKKLEGHNIVAVNRSMGCYSCASASMLSSLLALNQAGVLVVNAAGNESRDTGVANFYPSAYRLPGLISVAAHDPYGRMSTFSNYGSQVDIAALGEGVTTTSGPNGQAMVRGTSFAAPYVAGVAAMVKAQNPSFNLATLKMRVLARGYDSGTNSACQLHGLVPSNKLASVKLSLDAASCANPKPTIVYPVDYRSPANSFWGEMRKHAQNIFTAGATHVLAAQVEICTGQTQGLNFETSDGQIVAARDDGVYPDKMARDGLYAALFEPSAQTGAGQSVSVQAVHLLGNQEIQSDAKNLSVAQSGVYQASIDTQGFSSIAATGRRLPFSVSGAGFSQGSDENVKLPFPIFFSGLWQDEFYVSNSGRICFQYALAKHNKGAYCNAPPWYKDALPNGWRQNDGNASYNQTVLGMIAPWWDAQWGNGNVGIYVQEQGSAPNRSFIVSWEGMKPTAVSNSTTASASFQVVFFEGKTHFKVAYGNTVIGSYGGGGAYNMDNGITATVGVQHYTGKTGLTLSYRTAGSSQTHGIFSNRSYRYDFIPSAFSDVRVQQASAVNAVVAASVADGCSAQQYCPEAPLTREHAAAWIGRVVFGNDLVSDYYAPINSQFADVSKDNPYFRHIHAAQSINAFSLCGAGSFCPQAAVTSQELVNFVYTRVAPYSKPDLIPLVPLTRQQASELVEAIARPQDFYY